MHKKIQTFLLFLLILTTDFALGKFNKTKSNKSHYNKNSSIKEKLGIERTKRSIAENKHIILSNKVKRQIDDDPPFNSNTNKVDYSQQVLKSNEKLVKDEPFWANRGRRDGSPEEFFEYEYPEFLMKLCEDCVGFPLKTNDLKNVEARGEDFTSPFWANRGRRSSFEIDDVSEPFWGNRGRRQEKEPFWGNRGRRTENEPFWGNRGRREEEPFWGNRGRREVLEPFWGNRGRRQDSEPFWGNRGRRQDNGLHWRNRAMRDDPFWGNRGRRDDPFWGNRGRRKEADENLTQNKKEDLKEYILKAIDDVETDIENLSRLKKSVSMNSVPTNKRRDNKLLPFFNQPYRPRTMLTQPENPFLGTSFEPGTVLDNKMYVEEPNYILVERSSRSSGEDDPYYISRGKKYYFTSNVQQAARDRRGAIEEIVKSVRNDPYYIARGKKDNDIKNDSFSASKEKYKQVKELICAAINLIIDKKYGEKVKREISDNDRDRRTILKKLAAQLQMDPYFVSRGKKSETQNENDYLQKFISNVASKCD